MPRIIYIGTNRPKKRGKDWAKLYRESEIIDGEKFLIDVFSVWQEFLLNNAAWFIWYGYQTQNLFERVLASVGIHAHQQIIWAKPIGVFGFAKYRFRHEPCFFGWRKGNLPYFHPRWFQANHTSVWEIDWDGRKKISGAHPIQKPVELFSIPMRNHTREDDICAEPFCGSGSQIIAGELENRRG